MKKNIQTIRNIDWLQNEKFMNCVKRNPRVPADGLGRSFLEKFNDQGLEINYCVPPKTGGKRRKTRRNKKRKSRKSRKRLCKM